jgi:hypothetical protein
MQSKATTVDEYIDQLPDDRKESIKKIRQIILDNIPNGFVEEMNYGMIGYVVPHSLYPEGYHCNPKQSLPFVNIASQKNHIAFYHMGIYAIPELLEWFTAEYPKHSKFKLDIGKSCVRFKKPERITFELIGELMQKITPDDWIEIYETNYKK